MDGISSQAKCMASLAVFRDLYSQKRNTYSVLADFINQSFITRGISTPIESSLIRQYLMEDYGLKVPIAIIKPSIKKSNLVHVNEDGLFFAEYEELQKVKQPLDEQIRKSTNNVDVLVQKLYSFTEKRGLNLSDDEKNELKKAFCSYIVDENSDNEYTSLILLFIIENQDNQYFIEKINAIKEGLLLHLGLTYQSNNNQIDAISNDLHIYLETEILFHALGYNGSVFKEIFEEFFSLVKEINTNSRHKRGKDIIYLHYFEETVDEIESFFGQAIRIKEGKDILDKSKQAMDYIVSHCEETYNIQEMLGECFTAIHNLGITKDNQANYYSDDYTQFNISYTDILDKEEYKQYYSEKIQHSLNLLNHISVKRGKRPKNVFNNIGHILLSGKKITNQIAQDSALRNEGDVPLATTLSFLTNRFWFALKKNFVGMASLKTFDIIVKTRIALSAQLSDSVACRFEQVKKDFKNGKLTEEKAKESLAWLRHFSDAPEDISADDKAIGDYLDFLDTPSIEQFISIKNSQEAISQQTITEHIQLLSVLQKRKNEDAIKKYEKELQTYEESIFSATRKKYKKLRNRSSIIVAIYILVFLILIGVIVWAILKNKSIAQYVSIGLTALQIALMFIPVSIGKYIRQSFTFLFDKDVRNEYMRKEEQTLRSQMDVPKLRTYTIEEIKDEYLGEGSI